VSAYPETDDAGIANDMIGQEQEGWRFENLASSGARWNVIGNQIGMFDYTAGSESDLVGWDDHGYARDRISPFLDDYRPSNPVVITGDLHCSWVSDLKAYYPDKNSATVGTEFVGTSITSSLGDSYANEYKEHREDNPHVRFFDERTGGYVRCEVTLEEWRTEMKLADSIEDPESPVAPSSRLSSRTDNLGPSQLKGHKRAFRREQRLIRPGLTRIR
jgi:alkaline phosphatase D